MNKHAVSINIPQVSLKFIYFSKILKFVFQEVDRSNRFEFLLKQTEIFSHFMVTGGNKKNAPSSPLKIKAAKGRQPAKLTERSKLMEAGE